MQRTSLIWLLSWLLAPSWLVAAEPVSGPTGEPPPPVAALSLPDARDINAAPLVERRHGPNGTEWRALGPFFGRWQGPAGEHLVALRPVFSRLREPAREFLSVEFLWPILYGYQVLGEQTKHHGLFVLLQGDDDATRRNAEQFMLLPFYAHGMTKEGETFRALFPIYGGVRNLFGSDAIRFALFPLWLEARKGQTVSHNWLWPVYNRTEGPELQRWRLWPFYGRATRPGKLEAKFYLWPFFHTQKSLDPAMPGDGWLLFPLWGHSATRSADGKRWSDNLTFLWPFFTSSTSHQGTRRHLPWPFVQKVRQYGRAGQPDSTRTWYWPLYGETRTPERDYIFWFWPLGQNFVERTPTLTRERQYFLPFFWATREQLAAGGQNRDTRVWPLYSLRERADGAVEHRVLDLWPVANTPAVERNWSPLWTLYQRQSKGADVRQELLWGLWQHERQGERRRHGVFPLYHLDQTPGQRRVDLLTGLIGWESGPEGKRLRLFWRRW